MMGVGVAVIDVFMILAIGAGLVAVAAVVREILPRRARVAGASRRLARSAVGTRTASTRTASERTA
jgi:hypothetical protein